MMVRGAWSSKWHISIQPVESELVHYHLWQSILVNDRTAKVRDSNGKGQETPLPIPDKFEIALERIRSQ